MPESLLMRYMQPLLAGRRAECFNVIGHAAHGDSAAEELICDVVWPAMVQVDRLYRDDRINTATEHMACRINRTVADQLQGQLREAPRNGKRIIVACAPGEHEELGAEIVGDLLQADGWDVSLLGGGVPNDEILSLVGKLRPDVLLIFGTQPEGVPETRRLVELIREVGVCPTMNIVVSGGIYNRADGLWQEVGADVYSDSGREIRRILRDLPPRKPNAPRLALVKKRRRRRKPTTPPQTSVAAGTARETEVAAPVGAV